MPGGGDCGLDAALHDAQAELIYTGITRGKRLVVLVGQKRALAMAVKGKETERRYSKLAEWLRGVPG
jgi:exodeoxyribonuclease V alpha subunit